MLDAGLRALQGRKELEKLVKRVKATRDSMAWGAAGPPPLLVKMAPDITDADKSDIAAVALRLGIDGLVVTNTTIQRPAKVAALPNGDEVILCSPGNQHGPFLSMRWHAMLASAHSQPVQRFCAHSSTQCPGGADEAMMWTQHLRFTSSPMSV